MKYPSRQACRLTPARALNRHRRRLRSSLALTSGLLAALLLAACGGGPKVTQSADSGDLLHVSCLQAPPSGTCSRPRPAFYYDYQTDSCRPFFPGVCDPNWPFQSVRDCLQVCGGRAAP
jgi:hypothetical protein